MTLKRKHVVSLSRSLSLVLSRFPIDHSFRSRVAPPKIEKKNARNGSQQKHDRQQKQESDHAASDDPIQSRSILFFHRAVQFELRENDVFSIAGVSADRVFSSRSVRSYARHPKTYLGIIRGSGYGILFSRVRFRDRTGLIGSRIEGRPRRPVVRSFQYERVGKIRTGDEVVVPRMKGVSRHPNTNRHVQSNRPIRSNANA